LCVYSFMLLTGKKENNDQTYWIPHIGITRVGYFYFILDGVFLLTYSN
jgi:hypothetical protein